MPSGDLGAYFKGGVEPRKMLHSPWRKASSWAQMEEQQCWTSGCMETCIEKETLQICRAGAMQDHKTKSKFFNSIRYFTGNQCKEASTSSIF